VLSPDAISPIPYGRHVGRLEQSLSGVPIPREMSRDGRPHMLGGFKNFRNRVEQATARRHGILEYQCGPALL
jgi:hypothetical protein